MSRPVPRILAVIGASAALWLTGAVCASLNTDRATAALLLLLGVLAIATTGDRVLAIISPIVASVTLNYFLIERDFLISSLPGAVPFAAMVITAFTGSQLSIRAQRRAGEAIRRREEMERLQQLVNKLLAAQTEAEAGVIACREIVNLFGVSRAVLRAATAEYAWPPAEPGGSAPAGGSGTLLGLRGSVNGALEFFGPPLSSELSSALVNLLELVFDRARSFEERARIEAVQRGDELRATILNAVAHDFRTPLTSIKAAASALRASSASIFEPDRELVAVIDEEADRLDTILRESLALARLESLGRQPATELCSIPGIVDSVKTRLRRYLDRRRVEIDIPEDLPPIPGDRFLIEQMLVQVVENAWKYSHAGARIAISARLQEPYVSLAVWNEGLRIPDEEKGQIFDKFYRGANGRGRTEGSGLGLAIAKSIAEAHRGGVWFEDQPDGASFRFLLPIGPGVNGHDREPHHSSD